MQDIIRKHPVEYKFSKTEKLEISRDMATAEGEIRQMEAQKANVNATLGAEIRKLKHEMSRLADLFRCGYEMREMDCRFVLDSPRPGYKTIIRMDTGEVIDDHVVMTPEEMQRKLAFGGETKQ